MISDTRRSRIVAIAASLILAVPLALALPAVAHAQNSSSKTTGDMGGKTQGGGGGNQAEQTNSYTLTQGTYDAVQRIQKLISAEHYDQALSLATKTLPRASRESKYADALLNQMIANIYLLQKDYEKAEPYLDKIVQLDALQPDSQEDVIYQLANIYLVQKKYAQAVNLYKEVLSQKEAQKKTPDPQLYYQLGLAYSFENHFQQAYDYIKEAIDKSDEKHQDWYQNFFIVAYKLKDYHKANDIAETLVVDWPDNKDFWNYYANTYLLLKDDRDAAAVYALMYKRGMFKTKEEYLQLANLYLEENAPYKAGKLIDDGMNKGIIPKNVDNYDILANAFIQSREWDKALDALGKEAQLSPTGKVYLRQASIYLNQEDYPKAASAAQNAIDKGGLKDDEGRAWMVLGQAAFAEKNWDTALHAFHQAEQFKSERSNAKSWVQYVSASRNGG